MTIYKISKTAVNLVTSAKYKTMLDEIVSWC